MKKGWTFEVFTSIFTAVMLKLRNFLQVQPSVKKKSHHTSSGDQEFFCYDFFFPWNHMMTLILRIVAETRTHYWDFNAKKTCVTTTNKIIFFFFLTKSIILMLWCVKMWKFCVSPIDAILKNTLRKLCHGQVIVANQGKVRWLGITSIQVFQLLLICSAHSNSELIKATYNCAWHTKLCKVNDF